MRRAPVLGFVLAGLIVGGLFAVATARAGSAATPSTSMGRKPSERSPVAAEELRLRARVILVTLDGARWQDVLDQAGALGEAGERPAMPDTLSAVQRNGVALLGKTSSRAPLSLPGYQALAAGRTTACEDNDCPRIAEETLAEGLARRLGVAPAQVAIFASWSRVSRAAAASDGRVHVDTPADGPQRADGPPWEDARWDAETVEQALAHFRAHAPRFMHVALLDMDERAHRSERRETVAALRAADRALARLLEELARLPEEERRLATVLVTTDHGRGPARLWADHGPYAQSRDVFLLAIGDLVRGGGGSFTQADVRPTVERLLGLCPASCKGEGCGAPAPAVVGDLPCAR